MNQKVLLTGLCALLLGAICAVLMLGNGEDDGPQLAPQDAAPANAGPAAMPSDATAPAVAEASGPAAGDAAARDAVADATGKRPIPDGATWITVTVIDAASQAPVPGAEVSWYDEKAWEHLMPRRSRFQWDPAIQQIWRQPEAIAARVGWQTRTDDKGQARVALCDNSTVAALHEGKFGQLLLRKNTVTPTGGHRLLLTPDHSLVVRVVDDAGEPCSLVPINVQPYGKDDKEIGNFRWQTLGTTGADGMATLPHMQQLLKQAQDEQLELSMARWHVRPMLPGDPQRGVQITLDNPPTEPVLLRLGPSGAIKVRATNGGQPLASFDRAQMQEDRSGQPEDNMWVMPRNAPVDPDGWARFRHVPLGRRFHVMDGSGNLRTSAPGPLARGQEVEVVLRVANDALTLTGRIIDSERMPVADEQFQVQARGPNVRHWGECRTDAQGRFLVTVGKPRKDNRIDELTFTLQVQTGDQPKRAELTPRTLRPGVEDVGDLVLGEGTLVVAGRLVAGDAAYTKQMHLDVEVQDAPSNTKDGSQRQPRWRSIDNQLLFVDGKGAFRVSGKAGNGRHRLTIHPHEALPLAPIEFQPGEKDLVVRIDPGAPLAASVMLPERLESDTISAVLIPAKPPAPEQKRGDGQLTAHPENGREERYDLQWAAAPLGSYALELRLRTQVAPLMRLEAVEVPGPEGGDPRLVDIDLRGMVRKLTLNLLAADGKPLDDANGMLFAGGQREDTDWVGQQFWQTKFPVLLPQGQLDLLLCAQGFQPQALRGPIVGDTLDVRLEPWPTVEVVVPNVPQLPKGADLSAQLQPTAAPTGVVKNQWGNSNRADYMTANGSTSLENGRGKVAIGDGPHRLRIRLEANRRSHEFKNVAPEQVLANAGSVVVQITEEQWKQALAATAQPPK